MDNLNDKYSSIVFFLNEISSGFCTENNIKLSIEIPSEDKLNASVGKVREKGVLYKNISRMLKSGL